MKSFVLLPLLLMMAHHSQHVRCQDAIFTRPSNISSVVFALSYCGLKPAANVTTLTRSWYWNIATNFTMQQYLERCSFGRILFRRSMNIVAPQIIEVPCQGISSRGVAWNLTSKCADAELYGMMEYAENYAVKKLNITLPALPGLRRIALLPQWSPCMFSGLANMGCWNAPRCNVWINGYLHLPTIFHELQHNVGSRHSRRGADEYGDTVCAMGSGDTCLNAPQNWRLGWAVPIVGGEFNTSQLEINVWTSYILPAQYRMRQNMIRILVDTGPTLSVWPAYYISYRVPNTLFFEKIRSRIIAVHSYANMRIGQITNDRTQLLALVGNVGGRYAAYGANMTYPVFLVRVDALAESVARISVCRPARGSTSCP